MTATITAPTVAWDMPEDDYHADPVTGGSLSHSMAKVLIQPGGPAKLRWQLDNPQPYKKVFDFGRAAHALVLGVGAELRMIPDEYLASNGAASTKAAKDFIAQAREDGATPLKQVEFQQIKDMALQLARHPEAVAVLTADGARHEVSAFTVDPHTGVVLRCRFDTIASTGLGDYKTAATADPHRFNRAVLDNGYHQQHPWYLDTAAALDLVDPDAPFKFVVQEKTAPYLVSVIQLDAEWVRIGRDLNRRAIDLFVDCTRTGQWPGYETTTLTPPPWAYPTDTQLDPAIEAELLALMTGDPA